MTLRDYMLLADPEETYYVSAADGNAFVFIGTPARLETDYEEVDIEMLRRLIARQTHALVNLRYEWRRSFFIPMQGGITTDSLQLFLEFIQILEDYTRAILKARCEYDAYISLPKREVLAQYRKKAPGEEGIVLIVNGTDQGPFWLRQEYEKFIKREKGV